MRARRPGCGPEAEKTPRRWTALAEEVGEEAARPDGTRGGDCLLGEKEQLFGRKRAAAERPSEPCFLRDAGAWGFAPFCRPLGAL